MKIKIEPNRRAYDTFATLEQSSNITVEFIMTARNLGIIDRKIANKMGYAITNAFAEAMRKPPVVDADTRYIHVNILTRDDYEKN